MNVYYFIYSVKSLNCNNVLAAEKMHAYEEVYQCLLISTSLSHQTQNACKQRRKCIKQHLTFPLQKAAVSIQLLYCKKCMLTSRYINIPMHMRQENRERMLPLQINVHTMHTN